MAVTFGQLEKLHGIDWKAESPASPLTAWYLSVRDTPISRLSIADLCRAIRQEIFADEVVVAAIDALKIDVNAGDQYDGELIAALAGLGSGFWRNNRGASAALFELLSNLHDEVEDADINEDIDRLLVSVRSTENG